MAHRSYYTFLLMCICRKISRGLGRWVHRTRRILTWLLELTVNPVDFILPGYCSGAVPIGRACILSCFLFVTIMTKCMNSTTEFTVDLFFWPYDFKGSWPILERYFMRKVRFAIKGGYSNMPLSIIFFFLSLLVIYTYTIFMGDTMYYLYSYRSLGLFHIMLY